MSSIDPNEVAKFESMAREWWDPSGKFKPLHLMNPCRLDYIIGHVAWHFGRDRGDARPLDGLAIADIGTGGGLIAEPLVRLGANMTGIDAAPTNIQVAKIHAEAGDLDIDYQNTTAEVLVETGAQFDVVVAYEIVEHVADPAAFVATLARLLKPGGMLLMSTLNRNPKSYLFAIIGAEYVMRWLPKGTHEWKKFITPDELQDMIAKAGLTNKDRAGMVFNPIRQSWSISRRDLSVNYAVMAVRD